MFKVLQRRKTIVCLHTMDPRGTKVGGIETHVQLLLKHHPASTSLLLVGIDEKGDLPIGKVTRLVSTGRTIDFLPLIHVPSLQINRAATILWRSVTLRFALAALMHLGAINRAVGAGNASAEIERYEFALIPKLLRLPFVLIAHNELSRTDKMDSLLKHFWFLHIINERLAFRLANRIFAVNKAIEDRIATVMPSATFKTEVMPVSVDTTCFRPCAFPNDDDAFHLCYAGRLDDFKDPPLMFDTLRRLRYMLEERPAGRFKNLVFHYIGASDPRKFSQYASIKVITLVHGSCRPEEVATFLQRSHAGILTSFSEGMPCYLLEMIACGRPVGAVTLPQYKAVIIPSVSGALVDRKPDRAVTAAKLAAEIHQIAVEIDAGSLDPHKIANLARAFSVHSQLQRLFGCHEALGNSQITTPVYKCV